MTAGSILLSVALLVLVGLYVFRPILTPTRVDIITDRDKLLAEKDALLNAIKSLDFDYETGKMPMDQYESERTRLKIEAANVLRNADQLSDDVEGDINAQIEAAIAAIRNKAQAAAQCDNCKKPVSEDDKFCANCGEAL